MRVMEYEIDILKENVRSRMNGIPGKTMFAYLL